VLVFAAFLAAGLAFELLAGADFFLAAIDAPFGGRYFTTIVRKLTMKSSFWPCVLPQMLTS
jgi:hypothetical protein